MSLEVLENTINSDGGFRFGKPLETPRLSLYSIYDNRDYFCDFCHEFDNKRRVRFLSHDIVSDKSKLKIQKALEAFKSPVQSDVNVTHSYVDVTFIPNDIKLSEIVEAIESEGILLTPDKSPQKALRHDLMRIGLAAFSFLNVMLFSSAEYLAGDTPMDTRFVSLFHWIQLTLTLPVVIYSAFPLLRNSFYGLSSRRFTVDQPIFFAIAAAYVYSVVNVISSSGPVYFDSICGIVFFMSSARFFQKKFLEKTLRRLKVFDDISASFVKQSTADADVTFLNVSKVLAGTQFFALNGDTVPVNSFLERGLAEISYEQINGEPNTKFIKQGEQIKSGAILVSSRADLRSDEAGVKSYIYLLKKQTIETFSQKTEKTLQVEKMAGLFFIAVAASAVACFLINLENLSAAFNNSISMLLVACPCSFAVAIPLAHAKTFNISLKQGIAFKNSDAIAKLARVDHFIFDKTGTLTTGKSILTKAFVSNRPVNLQNRTEILESKDWKIVYEIIHSCSQVTDHHAVRSLKNFLSSHLAAMTTSTSVKIDSVKNGFGIKGKWSGKDFTLGSKNYTNIQSEVDYNVFLTIEGQMFAGFLVEDSLRSDSLSSLDRLKSQQKSQQKRLSIISGDRSRPTLKTASLLGIKPSDCYAEKSPSEKKSIVEELSTLGRTAMIGDGTNDALALASADVGINVSQGSTILAQTSDITFLNPGIACLPAACDLAKDCSFSVRTAFGFASAYNIAGIVLAFHGVLTPLVAAVSMPINSVIVSFLAVAFIREDET